MVLAKINFIRVVSRRRHRRRRTVCDTKCETSSTTETTDEGDNLDETTSSIRHPEYLESPQRKSVRFADQTKEFYVSHLRYVSKEEIAASWYSETEYFGFRMDCRRIVARMMQTSDSSTSFTDDEENTFRGLEDQTPEALCLRNKRITDSRFAVLAEQDRLRKIPGLELAGTNTASKRIAEIYLQHSVKCRVWATLKGIEDEVFVMAQR